MKKFYAVIILVIAGVVGSLAMNPSSAADPRDVTITLRAADNISGVTMMQIAEDKNNPPPAVAFESVTVINTAANALWVRIQDRATNWSNWVQIIVGADPYQDTANFNTIPTPTASATSDSGGGGGGGFIGGGGGGGFIGGELPLPETTTSASPSASETVTATASPTPSISTSATPTPTPSPSRVVTTPTPTPIPTMSRPDLVRASAPAVSKSIGGGLTQLSASVAARATVISSSPPAKTAQSAPTANATIGAPVAPLIKALPSKSKITVTTVINGKTVTLGKVTTNSKGEVLLPAFSSSKAGTITVAMKTASGKVYYTKVKFSARK